MVNADRQLKRLKRVATILSLNSIANRYNTRLTPPSFLYQNSIMKKFLLGLFLLASSQCIWAQLQAGPMLGYVDFLEARVWVQTKTAGKYAIRYWKKDDTQNKFQTPWISTENAKANTATFVLEDLEEGSAYSYQILTPKQAFDKTYGFETQKLWRFRNQPPAFTLAIGSCHYTNEAAHDRPGTPYGNANTEIFNHIIYHKPDMMLWLGDNIYLREVDFGSRKAMYRRYSEMRKDPNLKELLANTSNIAIWDDHDFGPNDADGSYVYKHHALDAFKSFWANPSYGLENKGGITSMFQMEDGLFFLLDNRYNRGRLYDAENATLLGVNQLKWMKDALFAAPKGDLKFLMIGGQILNSSKRFEHYIHLAPKERQEILDFICDKNIENVYILSGDKHHSEVNDYTCPTGGNTITEFTISPLTSKSYPIGEDENNIHQTDRYFYDKGQNFGILKVEGDYGKRKVSMHVFDKNNSLQFSFHKKNGDEE